MGELTHEWKMASLRWDVEFHAFISVAPVIARPLIPLEQDTIDAQCFETRGKCCSPIR